MSRGGLPNFNFADLYLLNPLPTINSSNKTNQATDQTLVKTTSQNCLTRAKKAIYSNSWKIEDFARVRNENMVSSVFSGTTGNNQHVSWHYRLNTHEVKRVYGLRMYQYRDIYHVSISIHFKTNCTGQNVEIRNDSVKCDPISGIIGTTGFNFIMPRDEVVQKLLSPDGTFTLRFTVQFINDDLEDASRGQPSLPKSTLVTNLASLLQNDQFADLTISVSSETFRAHKALLVARSSVFAAMFQHDMQEAQRNQITIKDMEPKVFREVLRFIYTDQVEGLPQMACELLAAADRYDLARLKVMCEIALIKCITVNSATETLIFADLHRAKELKARTVQFIGENLMMMPNWGEFCSARPDLIAEILNGVAASK